LEAKTRTLAACAFSSAAQEILVRALRDSGGFELHPVLSADELRAIGDRIDAAVLYNTRERSDLALFSQLLALGERVPLVVIGGGSGGASSGVTCALPPPAVLGPLLGSIVDAGPRLGRPDSAFPDEEEPTFAPQSWRRKADMILGESRATKQLLRELNRLASSSALVNITGESGTGKELVARALHYSGPRAREPFVALNCAAIPEPLVEAELFGYQRGAFTGAVAARAGAFEAAQKGTLFLDEIGEMSRATQPKLLRVLEQNEIVRVGSTETRPVFARVVAASNRDLRAEVTAGRFREDLFYRLNSYPVHIEPLRRRPEDIPPIVAHHVTLVATRENRPVPRVTPAAIEKMLGYPWPGNVRELVHVVGRALLASSGSVIDAEHIDLPVAEGPGTVDRYRDAKQRFEVEYYVRLMRVANGNVALAARLADKTRKEVYDAFEYRPDPSFED
jgi:two-component system response regulator GlrR